MKRLQRPLSRHLDPDVDEAALARIWARRRPPRSRRALPVGILVGASLVLVVFALRAVLTSDPASSPSLAAIEAGSAPHRATLPDDSTLLLSAGARVEPLMLDPTRVLLHQRRGRVEYRVAPDPGRRFLVEAGAVSVEVTGTRFVVDRDVDPVNVEVLEGSVIVRGDGLPDRVVRLGPGESISSPVVSQTRGAAPTETLAPPAEPAELVPDEVGAPVPGREPPTGETPSEPTAPPMVQPNAVSDWLAEADLARREGRFRDAVAPLSRVASAGGPQSAVASYSLGRLYMDELGDPAAAALAMQHALTAGLPTNLREPARHRHFRALLRSDVLGASDAADAYLASHPDGPHAEEVRQWLAR